MITELQKLSNTNLFTQLDVLNKTTWRARKL